MHQRHSAAQRRTSQRSSERRAPQRSVRPSVEYRGYRTNDEESEGFKEGDKSVGFFMLSYSSTRFNVSASVNGCGFTKGIPPFSVGNKRQK